MLSQRGFVVVAAVGLLTAGIAAGCGDDSTNDSNEGGGGTTTTSSTTTSSVSTTSNTTSSTTTGPGEVSFVARACTADSDCGDEPGARCVLSSDDEPLFTSFFGEDTIVGGPAGGYCTKDCASDGDCPSDSICAGDMCLLECVFGEPVLEYLDDPIPADKCQGRDDLMCVPTQGGNALCLPVCGSDLECGSRSCDIRNRVCTDAGHPGLPLGSGPCVPDDDATPEDEDACAGFCLTFIDENEDPTSHICSANCSLGGDLSLTLNCGGPEFGICAFGASFDSGASEVGDYAFCTGACTQQDECNHEEGIFCFDIGLLDFVGKGYCFGTTDCPGGNECDAGEACFDTVYGPACIEVDGNGDPIFPLGDAAGGAGGAGGAAGGAGGAGGAAGGAGGAGGAAGGAGGAGGAAGGAGGAGGAAGGAGGAGGAAGGAGGAGGG